MITDPKDFSDVGDGSAADDSAAAGLQVIILQADEEAETQTQAIAEGKYYTRSVCYVILTSLT